MKFNYERRPMPGGIIRTYKNGKLSGSYREHDQTGKLIRGGYYHNGVTSGYWFVTIDESWGLEEKFGIKAHHGSGLYERDKPKGLWWFHDVEDNLLALIEYTRAGPVLFKNYPPK